MIVSLLNKSYFEIRIQLKSQKLNLLKNNLTIDFIKNTCICFLLSNIKLVKYILLYNEKFIILIE